MLKYRFLFIFLAISCPILITSAMFSSEFHSQWLWITLFSIVFLSCFTVTILFINRFKKDFLSNSIDQLNTTKQLSLYIADMQKVLLDNASKNTLQVNKFDELGKSVNSFKTNISKDITTLIEKQANTELLLTKQFSSISDKQIDIERLLLKNEQFKILETRLIQISNELTRISKNHTIELDRHSDKITELSQQLLQSSATISDEIKNIEISSSQELSNISNQIEYKSSILESAIKTIFSQIEHDYNHLNSSFAENIESLSSEQQNIISHIKQVYQSIEQQTLVQQIEEIQKTILSFKITESFTKLEQQGVTNDLLINKLISKLETNETQNQYAYSNISTIKQLIETNFPKNLQLLLEMSAKNSSEFSKLEVNLNQCIQQSNLILSMRTELEAVLRAAIIAQSNENNSALTKIFDLHFNNLNLSITNNQTKADLLLVELQKIHANSFKILDDPAIKKITLNIDTLIDLQKSNAAIQLKGNKDLLRRINVSTNQIEAYLAIYSIIKPTMPLPQMRGWAISPDIANKLITYLLQYKPKTILNIGCGLSDIILSYVIKQFNLETKIISLESDIKFMDITRTNLILHNLIGFVELVYAPFKTYTIAGSEWQWYDLSELDVTNVDLLFIDGPPGTTQKLARYPALPLLKDYLSPNPIIILDDAIRQDEKDIAQMWVTENPEFIFEYFEDEKGTIVLKKR